MDIVYESPFGDVWPLAAGHRGVFIKENSLDDLCGDSEDVSTSPTGAPGQQFDGLNVKAMTGTLGCWVQEWEGDSLDEVSANFRSSWSRTQPGTLRAVSHTLGGVFTQVRLAKSMPPLPVDLREVDGYDLQFSVIADSGVWWMNPLTGTGTVTVTNPGDVPVYPRIRWKGAGGKVTLPSGASFTLPAAQESRIVSLDNADSCAVVDEKGVLDRALWRALHPTVMPEGIPVGQSRTYTLPDGSELLWNIGVFDPWK